jgi:hypothetical protein
MTEEKFQTMLSKVEEVKEKNEGLLFTLPNVIGVGIGLKEVKGKETNEIVLSAYVEKKLSRDKLGVNELVPDSFSIPKTSETIKTDVRQTGKIEALAFTANSRPAKPGYSIGHHLITAGTFGCLVKDVCPPCRIHILSNNHVLANSNAAGIGDPILQPGRHDGGRYPANLLAKLSRFIPITYSSIARYNLVDAALALPTNQSKVISSIVGLGIPKGTVEATLGMEVIKSGRTTEITKGRVIGIDATVAVNYGSRIAYFRNQIMTTSMSQGGDSGSLLMSQAGHEATGLLFAGSSRVTVHNNIRNVLMALGVEIVTP